MTHFAQACGRAKSSPVCEIDPLGDPRWQELIQNHPRSSVFHSRSWLNALKTAYGYRPFAFTTCAPDAPLTNAVVGCDINSWLTGRRLVSLPFSDHCEPLIERPDELDAILTHMKQKVDQEECKYIEIRPLVYELNGQAGLSRLVTHHFHSLDLVPDAEQLFRNFHKDCVQRKIRRAERENLQYEEGASEVHIQKFYRLLVMTRRRQHLPPQPLAWFRSLAAAFGSELKIRLASKDGVPVAGILVLSHKKSVVYKYGCSNVNFNKLGGTALLFWKTIQDAKDRGFAELELGRSDLGNAGLVAFKERWGASRRSITYWTYPRYDSARSISWRTKLASHVVPMIPDTALKAVGRVLYRHIG